MGQSYPSGYIVTRGADAPGNDIKHLTNAKMDDCARECNNDDKCKAFNYNQSGTCWIKHGFENITETNDWNFFIKENIKTTRPERLTCQPPDPKPSDTELQKLTACKDAMICYSKIIDYNEQITTFNDSQKALLKASKSAWKIREKRTRDSQADWDKRKQDIYNGNQESKNWNNCSETWNADAGKHDDWCRNDFGDGWYHSGKSGDGCTKGMFKGVCSKTDDRRNREATDQTTREKGDRPANFSEREPTQDNFPLTDQNQTSINMNCCSNYMNVTGNAKSNIQSCQQEIQQRINNPPPPPPPPPAPAPPPPAPAPSSTPATESTPAQVPTEPEVVTSAELVDEPTEIEQPKQVSDKLMYIIIGLLVLLLLLILLFYFQADD